MLQLQREDQWDKQGERADRSSKHSTQDYYSSTAKASSKHSNTISYYRSSSGASTIPSTAPYYQSSSTVPYYQCKSNSNSSRRTAPYYQSSDSSDDHWQPEVTKAEASNQWGCSAGYAHAYGSKAGGMTWQQLQFLSSYNQQCGSYHRGQGHNKSHKSNQRGGVQQRREAEAMRREMEK